MPKSELTTDETENLLAEAAAVFPDSDFVADVQDWFDDKGFITEAQEAALNKIVDGD